MAGRRALCSRWEGDGRTAPQKELPRAAAVAPAHAGWLLALGPCRSETRVPATMGVLEQSWGVP